MELCRQLLALHRDTHTYTRSTMVLALAMTGSNEEAMAAAEGLFEEAEATPTCAPRR